MSSSGLGTEVSSPGSIKIEAQPHSNPQWFTGIRPTFEANLADESLPATFGGGQSRDAGSPGLEQTAVAAVDAAENFGTFLLDQGAVTRGSVDPAQPTVIDTGTIHLRLREMSVAPQFEAVRTASQLPPGAEKERLLAVGYANLSLLTQHHWSPISKVFAARALVYAERAARKEPGDAAHEVQAYVMALVGLHGAALQHAEAVVAEPSPRLKAVIAYCHFRPNRWRHCRLPLRMSQSWRLSSKP